MITEGMTGLVETTGDEMMDTEEMMGTEEMTIEEITELLLPSTGIGEMGPAEMTREGEIQELRQTEMTMREEIPEHLPAEMTTTGGGILHQGMRGGGILHQGTRGAEILHPETRGRTEMWTKRSLPNPGHRP